MRKYIATSVFSRITPNKIIAPEQHVVFETYECESPTIQLLLDSLETSARVVRNNVINKKFQALKNQYADVVSQAFPYISIGVQSNVKLFKVIKKYNVNTTISYDIAEAEDD